MKMVVLREGEVEKMKRYARDARENEKFRKNCLILTLYSQNMCFL